tara:strand:+ start:2484 stop:3248 length:765 start_codon:yes stop_codon:yes gene_type:complete
MKSPIKNKIHDTKALHQILKIVPEGSIIDSYLFFGGNLELSLSKYNRFVCAHTNRYVVYEFWMCLLENPNRLYQILTSDHFKFEEYDLQYIQKKWAHFKDQYARSSMFFLLNTCTAHGQISYGEIEQNKISNATLADLKTFTKPKNFHLIFDQSDFLDSLDKAHGEYTIISAGNFTLNLLNDSNSTGLEETDVEHNKLYEMFKSSERKIILIYNNTPAVIRRYGQNSKTFLMIDKYGNLCQDETDCQEVLIANF